MERIFILLSAALFAFIFFKLYSVLQNDFEEVPQRIEDGSMFNLNDPDPGPRMKLLLQKGFYFEDPKDIELISSVIAERLHPEAGAIDNIGELNKRKYDVEADQAFARGGESFRKRVQLSRNILGYTGSDSSRYLQEKTSPPRLPAVNDIGLGTHNIGGTIYNSNGQALAGILVRIGMILPHDSIYSSDVNEVENLIKEKTESIEKVYGVDSANRRQLQSLTAYARTAQQVESIISLCLNDYGLRGPRDAALFALAWCGQLSSSQVVQVSTEAALRKVSPCGGLFLQAVLRWAELRPQTAHPFLLSVIRQGRLVNAPMPVTAAAEIIRPPRRRSQSRVYHSPGITPRRGPSLAPRSHCRFGRRIGSVPRAPLG